MGFDSDTFLVPCHKPRPFELTPRRKQVLWHIAYSSEIYFLRRRYWGSGDRVEYLQPTLDGVDIRAVCRALSKYRLIRWPGHGERIWITEKGIDVLLGTIR